MSSLDRISRDVLIQGLLRVKEKALNGEYTQWDKYGICSMWMDEVGCGSTYDFVYVLSKGWEHYSGRKAYPVIQEPDEHCWEGEQLILRLSLIDHLLEQLEVISSDTFNKIKYGEL